MPYLIEERVLVIFERAERLVLLAALNGPMVVKLPAHHHIVGCLCKVVLALCAARLVQAMTETVKDVVCEPSAHLHSQVAVVEP